MRVNNKTNHISMSYPFERDIFIPIYDKPLNPEHQLLVYIFTKKKSELLFNLGVKIIFYYYRYQVRNFVYAFMPFNTFFKKKF